MKKAYKDLRKKLKNHFDKPKGSNYEVSSSVGLWLHQCGVKPTEKHIQIIYKIFGSIPYPYQETDRKFILRYLKKNKYKDYTSGK